MVAPTIRILQRHGAGWSPRLEHLHSVPARLWVLGGAALPENPAVAVVGSRRATMAGLEVSRRIGEALARAGVPVISGMARGIDAAAHLGALDAGGITHAVLGCGVDLCYPPEHARLRARIVSHGALISELAPGTPPLGGHFPARNRLIAALACAVVVVEAAERSGALSTARHAADLGREVLAVPGSILSPASRGTNLLIRDGAQPVLEAGDVLVALSSVSEFARQTGANRHGAEPWAQQSPKATGPGHHLPPELAEVARLLGTDPVAPDHLAAALRLNAAEIGRRLALLEVAGAVRSLPGGLIEAAVGGGRHG